MLWRSFEPRVVRKNNKYEMRRADEEVFMAPEVYFAVTILATKITMS